MNKQRRFRIALYRCLRLALDSEILKISLRAKPDGSRILTVDWKKGPPTEFKPDTEAEDLKKIGLLLKGKDPAENDETKRIEMKGDEK